MHMPSPATNVVGQPVLTSAATRFTQAAAKQQPHGPQPLTAAPPETTDKQAVVPPKTKVGQQQADVPPKTKTDQQRATATPTTADQGDAAKRDRKAANATEQQPPKKRAKRLSAEEKTELLKAKNDNGLHFIELTDAYIAKNTTEEYKEVVTRAAHLTPAERAALLGTVANMIQVDQTKTLGMLEHSIEVSQHFARQAAASAKR